MPNTIILRGEQFTRREDIAAEAITPGMLLDFNAADKLVKHPSSGGTAAAMFAVELDYIGDEITEACAAEDRIPYADCAPGTIVYAHLASGQNVARGSFLMSAGTGALTARTSTNYAVAQADEDCNAASGADAFSKRIRARVI